MTTAVFRGPSGFFSILQPDFQDFRGGAILYLTILPTLQVQYPMLLLAKSGYGWAQVMLSRRVSWALTIPDVLTV